MYTVTFLIIILVILTAMGAVYTAFKQRINFFITGLDSGFSISEISLLWQAAEICNLEQPTSLYYSLPSLTKCMTQISNMTNTDNSQKNQLIMTKLFDYRTKIQNEADAKKGMTTTHSLERGQTLRIILPGKGVFTSEIVGNGNFLVINVPRQKNLIPLPGEEWVGRVISVYLWRKGDARYVFDTTVTQNGLFLGKSSLFLKHSSNLVRTQKRKAVRVKCQIYGMLYIIKKDKVDVTAIETHNGFRCLIEDISEAGALIRIGGKGVQNVKIKLQFNIQNKLILMVGVVRTVEYNEAENQSLLHFECTHIDTTMKNEILKFVYNMLPESEKEVLEALEQTETDEATAKNNDTKKSEAASNVSENNKDSDTENEGNDSEAEEKPDNETKPASEIESDIKMSVSQTSEKTETDAKNENKEGINPEDTINVF